MARMDQLQQPSKQQRPLMSHRSTVQLHAMLSGDIMSCRRWLDGSDGGASESTSEAAENKDCLGARRIRTVPECSASARHERSDGVEQRRLGSPQKVRNITDSDWCMGLLMTPEMTSPADFTITAHMIGGV